MTGQIAANPDEICWEQEYELLMESARKHLNPAWEYGEVVILKTAKGKLYMAEIPNFQDAAVREPLENLCIQHMVDAEDTEVFSCLATMNGKVPDILSWNFRSKLIAENKTNLKAMCFLWGGGEHILVKPFASLMPPEKS